MENNKAISSVWRALNTFTKGTHSGQKEITHHFTADAFNDHFLSIAETVVKSQDSSDSNKHYSCSKRLVDFCQQETKTTDPFTIPLVAVHEMGKYMSGMNNKKSSGPDEISKMLKLASPYVAGSLTYTFNLYIEQNVFPLEFQKTKVIPLPKTRDHKTLIAYRPISLLSVLSKLLERHVYKHLVTYLETRDLYHPLQSGFRRKHTCNTALARLTDSWLSVINRSDLSGDVFLDLKKAFNLVDHKIVFSKLSVYLNSSNSLPFFCSYLKNRVQRVFIRGSYSSEGTVKYGVPQGSVLGPVLFCI